MMNRPDVPETFQRQYGVASIEQLLALGVARSTIGRARVRGTLAEVAPGVFMTAGATLTFEAKCVAALLYLGPDSYLSGGTAAALHGCRGMPRRTIHATIRATAHVTKPPEWLRVHRSSWRLHDDVITRPDGIRLASPRRTLFDLASRMTGVSFDRLAEDMWHLKLATPSESAAYLDLVRRSGREGVTRLEEWLDRTGPRTRPAQSGLEVDVIDAIRSVGLPAPERQFPLVLLSGELVHIDVAWPAIQFGLEPGHSWWHGGNLRMHKDFARDNACGELGWFIRRLEEDVRRDLPALARLIKSMYFARAATFRPADVSPTELTRK